MQFFTSPYSYLLDGCSSFDYSLTTNGLCHTFNGVQLSELMKPKGQQTRINKAFENVFEKKSRATRRFRGVGQSEGKFDVYYVYYVKKKFFCT